MKATDWELGSNGVRSTRKKTQRKRKEKEGYPVCSRREIERERPRWRRPETCEEKRQSTLSMKEEKRQEKRGEKARKRSCATQTVRSARD